MLRAPRWCQCSKGQSTVQHPANANTVPQIWGRELPAATETHRRSRSKPSSRSLPQLCQQNLQEEQVRGNTGHKRCSFLTFIMTRRSAPLWSKEGLSGTKLSLQQHEPHRAVIFRNPAGSFLTFQRFVDTQLWMSSNSLSLLLYVTYLLNQVNNVQNIQSFLHWNVSHGLAFIFLCPAECVTGWRSKSNQFDFVGIGLLID